MKHFSKLTWWQRFKGCFFGWRSSMEDRQFILKGQLLAQRTELDRLYILVKKLDKIHQKEFVLMNIKIKEISHDTD